MELKATVFLGPEDIYLTDVYRDDNAVLELTTEITSGHVAVYRGEETCRMSIVDPLDTVEVLTRLDHLLDRMIFDDMKTLLFARFVLRQSARQARSVAARPSSFVLRKLSDELRPETIGEWPTEGHDRPLPTAVSACPPPSSLALESMPKL